jgi:hypothetical protein
MDLEGQDLGARPEDRPLQVRGRVRASLLDSAALPGYASFRGARRRCVMTTIPVLRRGSRGALVEDLQRELNQRLRPSPGLATDGIFGNRTDAAVRRFQTDNWLVVDGDVGRCTLNALKDWETYPPILHPTPFIPQPTRMTCWAASTAMMTRSTVPAVIARTPSDMVLPDGSIANDSDREDAVTNGRRFARAHGLTFVPPMSWGFQLTRDRLRRGPLMFDMLWDVRGYLTPTNVPGEFVGSSGHMIVVVGIRGDDDPTGRGTTLRLHDPWPPNRGRLHSVGMSRWLSEVPTRTYRVFHR